MLCVHTIKASVQSSSSVFTRALRLYSMFALLARVTTQVDSVSSHSVVSRRQSTCDGVQCASSMCSCGTEIKLEIRKSPKVFAAYHFFLFAFSLSSCNRREMWVVQQGIVQSLGKRQYTRAHFNNLRISLLWFNCLQFEIK